MLHVQGPQKRPSNSALQEALAKPEVSELTYWQEQALEAGIPSDQALQITNPWQIDAIQAGVPFVQVVLVTSYLGLCSLLDELGLQSAAESEDDIEEEEASSDEGVESDESGSGSGYEADSDGEVQEEEIVSAAVAAGTNSSEIYDAGASAVPAVLLGCCDFMSPVGSFIS